MLFGDDGFYPYQYAAEAAIDKFLGDTQIELIALPRG